MFSLCGLFWRCVPGRGDFLRRNCVVATWMGKGRAEGEPKSSLNVCKQWSWCLISGSSSVSASASDNLCILIPHRKRKKHTGLKCSSGVHPTLSLLSLEPGDTSEDIQSKRWSGLASRRCDFSLNINSCSFTGSSTWSSLEVPVTQ